MRARCVARWLALAAIALGLVGGVRPARANEAGAAAVAPDAAAAEPGDAPAKPDSKLDDEMEEDLVDETSRSDPFEPFNRGVFWFNRRIDFWLFDPITRVYQIAVPEPGRRAIYRAFQNLDSPVILANQMLQFRVVDAATTTTRFVINSSLGIAGLFDPAADWFEAYRRESDFGQTLARYGAPSGPYLMLPVFGPSSVRDVCGDVVDIIADPISYLLGPYQWWTLLLGGSEGITSRERHLQELQQLEANSIDFYSALRSAFIQSREAIIRESRENPLHRESPRPPGRRPG
jgi:phospholipid-binding lipoprotein MlaA